LPDLFCAQQYFLDTPDNFFLGVYKNPLFI
jgi:hypothetical protein